MQHVNKSHKGVPEEKKLTPRQLINKRIQNIDYEITDEEIKNLETVKEKDGPGVNKKAKPK